MINAKEAQEITAAKHLELKNQVIDNLPKYKKLLLDSILLKIRDCASARFWTLSVTENNYNMFNYYLTRPDYLYIIADEVKKDLRKLGFTVSRIEDSDTIFTVSWKKHD